MPIPKVRKSERSRTKEGKWRKKRNDTGKRRLNKDLVHSIDDVFTGVDINNKDINKDIIGIDWYVVYDWFLDNPNANDVEFVEYMEKIQNELIVIDNPSDA